MSKKRLFVDAAVLIVVIIIGLAVAYKRFVPRTLVVPDKYKTIYAAMAKAKAAKV